MTRILVVEDEQALNDITCDTLRDAGYEVTGRVPKAIFPHM
ncbi:response regulator transcription factor [Bifidobacterium sp. LC6]|uniref:Response regulator transcription factor n=1 Tax=Bifidobacterium colobi TaxID=2809026 RepID=A0ABS5UUG3_9BIFI|nr:hypothetical protein [Bifidobacterium colobi]MBT1174714.1 response regulator transcription factor [Bifidobacterium colobi]